MIKQIKINETIYDNFDEKYLGEDGNIHWNIPTNLEEFRATAIDTIKWQIGDRVKKATKTSVNLSASNAKAIALIAKILNKENPDLSGLTDLEKSIWNKMVLLADNGYADSEMLDLSLSSVIENISIGTNRIVAVTNATSIEEIIDILNS